MNKYILDPKKYGINYADPKDIEGGGPEENAKITINILKGEKGPKRDIVVLNAAAALFAGKIVDTIEDGIKMAEDLIDSGKAYKKYEELANN